MKVALAEWIVVLLLISGVLSKVPTTSNSRKVAGTVPNQDCLMGIWNQTIQSSGYIPEIPPLRDTSNKLIIYFTMWLSEIVHLIDHEETIVTSWLASVVWQDYRLTWDPDKFGGCNWINIPGSKIYMPDINIINSHESGDKSDLFDRTNRVTVFSDGWVQWFSIGVISTSCSMDLTYYPFDNQTCYIHIESISLSGDSMGLQSASDHAFLLDQFLENNQWELTGGSVEHNVQLGSDNLKFYIHLRRKSFYWLISLAAPIFILSMLTLTVFWIPARTGEKMGVTVTLFLSYMLFLALITTNLPPSSDTFPLLGFYLTLASVCAALNIVATTIVLHIGHKTAAEVPSAWFRFLINFCDSLLDILTICCFCSVSRSSDKDESKRRTGLAAAGGKHYGSTDKHDGDSVVDLSQDEKQLTPADAAESISDDRDDLEETEWYRLSVKLDRIFFWLFMWFNAGAILACFWVYPAIGHSSILFERPPAALNKTFEAVLNKTSDSVLSA